MGKEVWWCETGCGQAGGGAVNGGGCGGARCNGVDSGGARWGVTVRCGCLVCCGAECAERDPSGRSIRSKAARRYPHVRPNIERQSIGLLFVFHA